jgi:hypothetical protein
MKPCTGDSDMDEAGCKVSHTHRTLNGNTRVTCEFSFDDGTPNGGDGPEEGAEEEEEEEEAFDVTYGAETSESDDESVHERVDSARCVRRDARIVDYTNPDFLTTPGQLQVYAQDEGEDADHDSGDHGSCGGAGVDDDEEDEDDENDEDDNGDNDDNDDDETHDAHSDTDDEAKNGNKHARESAFDDDENEDNQHNVPYGHKDISGKGNGGARREYGDIEGYEGCDDTEGVKGGYGGYGQQWGQRRLAVNAKSVDGRSYCKLAPRKRAIRHCDGLSVSVHKRRTRVSTSPARVSRAKKKTQLERRRY